MIPQNQAYSQHSPFNSAPTQPAGPVNAPAPPAGQPGQPSVAPDPTMIAWRQKIGARGIGQGHTFSPMASMPLMNAIGANALVQPTTAPPVPPSSDPLPLQAAIRGSSTPPSQQGQNTPLLQALRQTMQAHPSVNM